MSPASPIKALIVEDEQNLRELVAFDFESAGFEVEQADSAEAAMEILGNQSIDAVISDLRMPGAGGVALLDYIKKIEKPSRPLLIFITGFADLTVDVAFEKGCDGFFEKPFGRRILVSAVNWLRLPRADRWKKLPQQKATEISKIVVHLPSLKESIRTHRFNLGSGGFFLQCNSGELPQTGKPVHFEIHFEHPEKDEINLIDGEGLIRWKRGTADKNLPQGVGIELLNLSPSCISKIIELQDQLKVEAYIPRQ